MEKLRLKWGLVLSLVLMLMTVLSSSVFAFQDIEDHPDKDAIMELKEEGMINGINEKQFNPQGKVTYAQGIHMIVKGMKLNMDHIRFIKAPKASDYFSNVPNDAWYAGSFITAYHNDLIVPKDVDPNQVMTREQYAYYLSQGIKAKGDFDIIKIWIIIADEQEIAAEYMESIQTLLILDIAKLDDNNNFKPKADMLRAEAAKMLNKARQFAKGFMPKDPSTHPQDPSQFPDNDAPGDDVAMDDKVTTTIEKVTDEINKVTVAWGIKPNSGYSITIDKIEFNADGKAIVSYRLHYPDPDMMYAQLVTKPKAETYISTRYTPVVKIAGDSTQADLTPNDITFQAAVQSQAIVH